MDGRKRKRRWPQLERTRRRGPDAKDRKREVSKLSFQVKSEVLSSRGGMSTSTSSSSAPWSFTSEPDSFGDEEDNVWNFVVGRPRPSRMQPVAFNDIYVRGFVQDGFVVTFCVGSSLHWR